MKNRKMVFRLFTVAQWEKEQAFLRKEHSKGWKLERVNFLTLYHFRRCEPEDMVYQLDFNPEGISHREEYLQMFRDCGWEYLQEYMGYSYFRKPVSRMEGRDEEIFCDDASRLDMMKRVFKGRMLPPLVVLLLIVVPNLLSAASHFSPDRAVSSVFFAAVLILALYVYIPFGLRFRSLWSRVKK